MVEYYCKLEYCVFGMSFEMSKSNMHYVKVIMGLLNGKLHKRPLVTHFLEWTFELCIVI